MATGLVLDLLREKDEEVDRAQLRVRNLRDQMAALTHELAAAEAQVAVRSRQALDLRELIQYADSAQQSLQAATPTPAPAPETTEAQRRLAPTPAAAPAASEQRSQRQRGSRPKILAAFGNVPKGQWLSIGEVRAHLAVHMQNLSSTLAYYAEQGVIERREIPGGAARGHHSEKFQYRVPVDVQVAT